MRAALWTSGRLAPMPPFLRRVGEGLDERREDTLEDHPRQILGDLLLVAAPLGQGRLEEGLQRRLPGA